MRGARGGGVNECFNSSSFLVLHFPFSFLLNFSPTVLGFLCRGIFCMVGGPHHTKDINPCLLVILEETQGAQGEIYKKIRLNLWIKKQQIRFKIRCMLESFLLLINLQSEKQTGQFVKTKHLHMCQQVNDCFFKIKTFADIWRMDECCKNRLLHSNTILKINMNCATADFT